MNKTKTEDNHKSDCFMWILYISLSWWKIRLVGWRWFITWSFVIYYSTCYSNNHHFTGMKMKENLKSCRAIFTLKTWKFAPANYTWMPLVGSLHWPEVSVINNPYIIHKEWKFSGCFCTSFSLESWKHGGVIWLCSLCLVIVTFVTLVISWAVLCS